MIVGTAKRAYPFEYLKDRVVVNDELASVPLTVWFDPGARSASAYDRRVGGKTLRFREHSAGRVEDKETKSLWTMDGICVRGPSKGTRLKQVFGLQAEWYGWYALHTDTTIWWR